MSAPRLPADIPSLLDAIGIGILLCEAPAGRPPSIVAVNARLLEVTGMPPPVTSETAPLTQWLTGVLGSRICEAVRTVAEARSPIPMAGEDDFPTGRLAWCAHLQLVAPSDAAGCHARVAVSFPRLGPVETAGVTRWRELQQALGEAEAGRIEAESANRAKSEFLAQVSHELRTPLNAIIGFAEIMAGEYFGPMKTAKYREYAQDIHQSGRHLLQLVGDITDISRIEVGRYVTEEEPVDLAHVAADATRLLEQRAAAKGVVLDARLAPVPLVLGHGRGLKQVILNLLSNSVKFTLRGGRVEIATRHDPDGGVTVVVADDGIGIPEGEIPRAMKAFGQASNAGQGDESGCGLGLAIACSIAEVHQAVLEMRSKAGVGTTVMVRLPPERVVQPRSGSKPWKLLNDA